MRKFIAFCVAGFIALASYAFELQINNNVVTGFTGNCPNEIVIPEGVIEIGANAFASGENDVTALKSVTIPASVVKINQFAFAGCANLTTVVWLGGIDRVAVDSFAFVGTPYPPPSLN